MGQFKPMVKMYTDEPSVILKLKKGGKVKIKDHGSHGHKSMSNSMGSMSGAHSAFSAEAGSSPKKPSVSERRRAMNLQQYKKGGKVVHKQMGGVLPAQAAPAAQAARAAAAARMARPGLAGPALAAGRPMKKGGATCAKVEKELKSHEKLEASKAHGKASGGKIDSAETKTTIEGNEKKFSKTKVYDGKKHDRAHGTGDVKMGKAAGYKTGGTIEGNVSKFAKTKVHDGDKTDKASGTGDVKMGNAGGYKAGGNVGWENRPANTSKKGVSGTSTGEVKESNAGGYKHGGAAKKGYATGGNVVDTGKAEKMPRHFVSRPVANSLQSGTFKRGGKVKHHAEGGSSKPISIAQQKQGEKDWRKGEEEWNESFRPEKLIGRAVDKVKGFFSPKPVTPPPGSVTKTEKSVTVAPKKRGGKC